MAERIMFTRSVKYAGDVHTELLKAGWDLETATLFVNSIPAADVAPVVHGRWEARAIPRSDPDGDWIALEYHCSLCNRLEYRKENYCPNCGARMDGE